MAKFSLIFKTAIFADLHSKSPSLIRKNIAEKALEKKI